MRATLRRSCDSCAKAKHRCDLQTPRCSRCIKRKADCVYANEPLTSSSSSPHSSGQSMSLSPPQDDADAAALTTSHAARIAIPPSTPLVRLVNPANTSYDPFDSYPPTRLPRAHVQRLIHHFLSSIAFQYYPLDMSMQSNPFIVSWWPLALEDPALFHVSLQTASLDEELRAQKGFAVSDLLMVDSVAELRKKLQQPTSAVQDETINAVVTLAAIEHGKGNLESSAMHIGGVKKMIALRGGISQVKRTNPLTARMVSWVSMLVTGRPQFMTGDDASDHGKGDEMLPTLQWKLAPTDLNPNNLGLEGFDIEPIVSSTLARLRHILHHSHISIPELHDLTCFVVHELLSCNEREDNRYVLSESLRFALVLYMIFIHGTTYYSHLHLADSIAKRLKKQLQSLATVGSCPESLRVWIISLGMMSSFDQFDRDWFVTEALSAREALSLHSWDDIAAHLHNVLWLKTQPENMFWLVWQEVFSRDNR